LDRQAYSLALALRDLPKYTTTSPRDKPWLRPHLEAINRILLLALAPGRTRDELLHHLAADPDALERDQNLPFRLFLVFHTPEAAADPQMRWVGMG
jgi:hypothetical protein